jgi:hypothetical protein
MAKVTLVRNVKFSPSGMILLNDRWVGQLEGSKEVYVQFFIEEDSTISRHIVARFKYKAPKNSAKKWVKFILTFLEVSEAVELLKTETPVGLETRIRTNSQQARPARFNNTFCSHCGNAFGPGNEGFSHCENHAGLRSFGR